MILQNNYLLVFISAFLTGLSQQPLGLGFICWFSLVPLLKVLSEQELFKQVIKYSVLWGFIYNLTVVFWLSGNIGTTQLIAIILMFLVIFILTFNTILIGILWYQIRKKYYKYSLYVYAVVWVSVEYLRSYGLLGFPWISLANTQTDYIYIIQNAEITGIYGITFWILLTNIFLFRFKSLFLNKKVLIVSFSILFLPWVSGYLLYHNTDLNDSAHGLKVLIVQPNIGLSDKRDILNKNKVLDNIINLTKNNLNVNHKLVVWPESALPNHLLQKREDRNYLSSKFFKYDNQYLLTGNIYYENNNIYNSVALLDELGIQQKYHKRQLVPLAEHLPFSEIFESLKNINIGQANFSKGKKDVVFNINEYRFASLVCFESTFPNINRRHANLGLDAIIYLVNDGWYTREPQPYQHAKQSIFRAIENRIPIVRCANTGISMHINRRGDINQIIGLNKTGTINVEINKNIYGKTFYTRFGNIFALILLAICVILLIKSFKKK